MRARDYDRLSKKYERAIKGMARNLAKTDDGLTEDLEQVGRFALSQLDPKRATRNRDAYIRQALYNRMRDFLREYNPQIYESLDHRMACGDQLEQLPTGEFYLITGRPRPPKLMDEDQYVADDDEEVP